MVASSMNGKSRQMICTAAIAATASAGVLAAPQTPPDEIKLKGTVRDFRADHPDFNITPADGYGHYAGNVELQLGLDTRPIFSVGAGYKVATEWQDGSSQEIPPHFFMMDGAFGGSNEIPVGEPSDTPTASGIFDSWDSSVGPYGGSNVGPEPTVLEGMPMPIIVVPASLQALPNQGDVYINSNTTISSDLHCDTLSLAKKTLTISGHVSILCDVDLFMETQAKVVIAPNSSVKIYLPNGGQSWNHVEFNVNTSNPGLAHIYNLGTQEFMIHNHAEVYATIISPDAQININNHGAFFGRFMGKRMEFGNHGDFHLDQGIWEPLDRCGNPVADSAGAIDKMSDAGVTSDLTFHEWYHDTLGVNLSAPHTITLTRNGSGIYEYLDDTFFPIDNELLGNEGAAHNFNFTYTFDAEFEYQVCQGMFFEFEGADDAWMYIGDSLALDLGGVLPGVPQHVEIDRLGLQDGETYRMRFFFAQRNGSTSQFRLRTNVQLIELTPSPHVASAGFD